MAARSTGSHATNWSPRGRSTSTRPGMTRPNVDTRSWKSSEQAVASSAMTGPSGARPSCRVTRPSTTTRCAAVPSTSNVNGGRSRSSTPRAASAPVSGRRSARSANNCSASITWTEPAKRVLLSTVVIGSSSLGRRRGGGDGAAAGDGAFVDAQVARDHVRIVAHGHGTAFGDHTTDLEAVHAVADAHDERHVVLDDQHRGTELAANLLDQRAERLRLTLRDPSRGLVEAQHPGVEREEPGELDDASGARGEIGDAVARVATEAEEADEVVGLR